MMRLLLPMIAACLLASCTTEPEPTVLRLVGSAPGLSQVESWKVDGRRDGAETRANIQLVLEDGSTLRLELLLSYDPTPILAAGSWSLGDASGQVTAERVRFVGGQGEGPSVGGVYVLADDRHLPRYRVTIPLTAIATPAPRP